jgi:hypothetical protein
MNYKPSGLILICISVLILTKQTVVFSQEKLNNPSILNRDKSEYLYKNQDSNTLSIKEIPPIGVSKLRSNIVPGTPVGGHYDGFLSIKKKTYYAGGSIDEKIESIMKGILEKELSVAGYNTLQANSGSIFSEQMGLQNQNYRFLIGGSLEDGYLKTYGQLAGNKTKSSRTILWEVFDKDTQKVIFSMKTVGESESKGVNLESIYESTRVSFKEFISSPEFLLAIKSVITDNKSKKGSQDDNSILIQKLPQCRKNCWKFFPFNGFDKD